MKFVNYKLINNNNNTIMNCSELMDLFDKTVGGVLVCNYKTNKMYVRNTNMKCDLKLSDYKKAEYLLHTYGMSPYEIENIKITDKNEINNSNIKTMNCYLNNDDIGFVINYSDTYCDK